MEAIINNLQDDNQDIIDDVQNQVDGVTNNADVNDIQDQINGIDIDTVQGTIEPVVNDVGDNIQDIIDNIDVTLPADFDLGGLIGNLIGGGECVEEENCMECCQRCRDDLDDCLWDFDDSQDQEFGTFDCDLACAGPEGWEYLGNFYCSDVQMLGDGFSSYSLEECMELASEDPRCIQDGKFVVVGSDVSTNFCGCGYGSDDACDEGERDFTETYELYERMDDDEYTMIGTGPCQDANGNRPPYCNPLSEHYSSLEDCEDICSNFEGCQAILYSDSWGCRVYFDTIENANGMLHMTFGGWDCHDDVGGEITQGDSTTDDICYIRAESSGESGWEDWEATFFVCTAWGEWATAHCPEGPESCDPAEPSEEVINNICEESSNVQACVERAEFQAYFGNTCEGYGVPMCSDDLINAVTNDITNAGTEECQQLDNDGSTNVLCSCLNYDQGFDQASIETADCYLSEDHELTLSELIVRCPDLCSQDSVTSFINHISYVNTDECNDAVNAEESSHESDCGCLNSADFSQFAAEDCYVDIIDEYTVSGWIDYCANDFEQDDCSEGSIGMCAQALTAPAQEASQEEWCAYFTDQLSCVPEGCAAPESLAEWMTSVQAAVESCSSGFDCNQCLSDFIAADGCACMTDDNCDDSALAGEECLQCGTQAWFMCNAGDNEEDNILCPADMQYNGHNYFLDSSSNEDVLCSDANSYCSQNDCGTVADMQSFYATTACCSGEDTCPDGSFDVSAGSPVCLMESGFCNSEDAVNGCMDCSHCDENDQNMGKCPECVSSEEFSMCPEGYSFTFGEDASFFDSNSNSMVACSDIYNHCHPQESDQCDYNSSNEVQVQGFFSTTDCCVVDETDGITRWSDNICPWGYALNRDEYYSDPNSNGALQSCGNVNDYCMSDWDACTWSESNFDDIQSFFQSSTCCDVEDEQSSLSETCLETVYDSTGAACWDSCGEDSEPTTCALLEETTGLGGCAMSCPACVYDELAPSLCDEESSDLSPTCLASVYDSTGAACWDSCGEDSTLTTCDLLEEMTGLGGCAMSCPACVYDELAPSLCDGCICTEEYDPVCADGVQYENSCFAGCEGVTEYTTGECSTEDSSDLSPACLAAVYDSVGAACWDSCGEDSEPTTCELLEEMTGLGGCAMSCPACVYDELSPSLCDAATQCPEGSYIGEPDDGYCYCEENGVQILPTDDPNTSCDANACSTNFSSRFITYLANVNTDECTEAQSEDAEEIEFCRCLNSDSGFNQFNTEEADCKLDPDSDELTVAEFFSACPNLCSSEISTEFFTYIEGVNTDECNTALADTHDEQEDYALICACIQSADFSQFDTECYIDPVDEFTLAGYINYCENQQGGGSQTTILSKLQAANGNNVCIQIAMPEATDGCNFVNGQLQSNGGYSTEPCALTTMCQGDISTITSSLSAVFLQCSTAELTVFCPEQGTTESVTDDENETSESPVEATESTVEPTESPVEVFNWAEEAAECPGLVVWGSENCVTGPDDCDSPVGEEANEICTEFFTNSECAESTFGVTWLAGFCVGAPGDEDVTSKVGFNMQLEGITEENFEENSGKIKKSVATAAGVNDNQVTVALATSRRARRALNDATIEVTIDTDGSENIQGVVDSVSDPQFSQDLTSALSDEGITTNVASMSEPTVEIQTTTTTTTSSTESGAAATDDDESGISSWSWQWGAIGGGILALLILVYFCMSGGGQQGEKAHGDVEMHISVKGGTEIPSDGLYDVDGKVMTPDGHSSTKRTFGSTEPGSPVVSSFR